MIAALGMRGERTACGKAILVVLLCSLALIAAPAHGQNATAQLAVNLKVQSSITLVFNNNPAVGSNGFCPLTNAGTNNVGLDLGSASYTGGSSIGCVSFFQIFNFYSVSSAFDVLVSKSNTSSPNYQLAAQISSAPPANVFWLINLVPMTTTFQTIQTNNNYGQPVTETLTVAVRNDVPAQTLQETITFLATAN